MPVCRLHSRDDLESLTRQVGLFDRPAAFRVELHCATSLSPVQRRALERRLAWALSDCGCALASLSILATMAWLYFHVELGLRPLWPNIAVYLAAVITAGGLTKLAGLYLSFRIAHRLIDRISASIEMSDRHVPTRPHRLPDQENPNVSLY